MTVRLHLLGTPRLSGHAGDEVLPFNKPSSLLYYLACRGTWIRRSEAAFLYRPDEPEEEALRYLRKLVFRARQLPWAVGLEVSDARLRWPVPSDLRSFRQAVDTRAWHEALAQYGGPLLDGVALSDSPGYGAWLDVEREALEAQWKTAAVRHAEHLARQDRLDDAASWLSRVLARDPLDEDTLQAYLQVLQADGRRHRALEVYDAFRATLRHEVDAEPLETTQALADSIRRGPGTNAAAAPPPAAERRHDLPTPTTRFVGRERELEQLASLSRRPGCRLVTVLGLGGIGKTRLALECAAQRVSAYPDGVWFVPLAGVTSASFLASSIADALGLTLSGSDAPEAEVAEHLREKSLLLLLDGFEHLTDGALFLQTLLETAPEVELLVTSRVALELQGEWLFDLDGLGYPPAGTDEPLERFDAVKLFVARAERLSNDFVVTGATLQAIASLCRKVEGMPLALELAATWTRSLGVPDLVESLGRGFQALATREPDVPQRHRNLRAVLDYTWSNLGDAEQRVLARLSLFRGGFTLEAAEAVADAHLGALLRLINHALVRRDRSGRYDLHELVRQFLDERLDADTRARTLDGLCGFFAEFAAQRERTLKQSDEQAVLRELDVEVDNLRLAWRRASEEGDLRRLRQMAECYFVLLDARGRYREGADAFRSALRRLEDRTDAAQQEETLGELVARAGYFEFRLGHLDVARHLLETSLRSLRGASAPAAEAFAHHYLGVLAFLAGDNRGAQQRYHQALARYEAANDGWSMTRTHNNLGVVADTLGDYDEAAGWYRLALELSREIGHVRGVASALVNLGVTLETVGRLEEAERHYQESLEVYREAGDLRGEAASLTNLGHLAEQRGAYVEARDRYERSVAIKRTLGDPVVTAVSLTNLGDVLLALGETPQALDALGDALTLARGASAHPYALRVVWSYAKLHARHGDWPHALYLATFLARCAESEAWVRRDAGEALDAWGAKVSADHRTEIQDLGRHVALERLYQDVKPTV